VTSRGCSVGRVESGTEALAGNLQQFGDQLFALGREWIVDVKFDVVGQPDPAPLLPDLGLGGDPRRVRVENTGVALELGSERVRGWVDEIEADGLAIWVQLEERIKSDPKEYTLSFDPTFVLNATLNLLLQLAAENQPVGLSAIERLFGLRESHIECGPPLPHDIADGLNDDQVRLVRTIDASDLVVGFGPPGTGKTRTGAAAIAYLAEKRNLRVLVTAHTNTALDTLMAAVVERLPSWVGNGKIVRSGRLSRDFQHLGIGYKDFKNRAYAEHAAEINATLNALEAEADVLLPPLAQPSHDVSFALLRRKRQQRTSRARKSDPTLRIEAIAARLAAQGAPVEGTPLAALASRLEGLRKTIRDGIGHPEKTARIVGATFWKLAVEPDAFNRYDVVVADEASMAQLAQMAIAAARAARRVLVLGDARQLPPIVQSRAQSAQEWLKRNVYVQLGLEDPASSDPRSRPASDAVPDGPGDSSRGVRAVLLRPAGRRRFGQGSARRCRASPARHVRIRTDRRRCVRTRSGAPE